jgi:predicted enzyme related to lactoylglutathione lyase
VPLVEIESYENGVPSWIDLGTADMDKAADFYSGLFGWQCEDQGPDAGGYRICTLRGKPVAGLGPQQNPGPPVWSTYVNVVDAEATAARVEAHNGQVWVQPFDVLDAGKMAVFADSVGAAISVWQPNQHHGAGIVNEPGTYSWSELVTTDVPVSMEFYRGVFGWEPEVHGEPGPGEYIEFKLAGRSIAGMMPKPPTMPAEVPPHWAVYFAVEDTDQAAARVTELGGQVIMPPMDIEPGRFAVVMDPTGATFNIIKMNPAAGG